MSATLDPRRREAARMAELDRLGAMRPGRDRVLQELVDDARKVFGAEFCMVNLVTADTQLFKVWSGKLPPEVASVRLNPRERSMCRHVVEDERPFVVEDFSTTERFRELHLRMGPGVRFYAGTPLKTSEGHAIGSLCLVDSRPRDFGDKDRATLRAFAGAVVGRLEALGAAAHERDARESERQYRRNIFELANDAILIYGTDTGLILDANWRACEMYGIRQEAFVGRDIAELALERESKDEHTREVLRRGSRRGLEAVHRRADGARMHVSINSSVTEYGGQQAILSIVRDVTERKRTEESLSLSERSLAQAQRIAHIGNWEHELRGGRTHWSDEMYRIFGFAPLALTPSYKTFMLFVHPDDRGLVRESIREVLRGNRPEDVEYRIVRPDGDVRSVHTQYEVFLDEAGRPAKFSGTVHDVTGRKRAEEALRQSEERYRLVARATNEVIWDNDLTTNRQEWNGAVQTMFGYSPQERGTEGRWWEDRLHPDDRPLTLSSLEVLLEGDAEVWTQEYRFRRKDGTYATVVDRGYVVRDGAGHPVRMLGSMMDITERKRTEEELEESRRRLSALLSNAPAYVYRCRNEPGWPNEFVSDYALELTGYTSEKLTDGSVMFADLIAEVDRERVWDEVQAALSRCESFELRYSIRRKDGEVRHVEERGRGLHGEGEVVEVIEGVVYDVTERVRAEEALREAEERYRTLVEQIPAVTYIDRADGTDEPLYTSPQIEGMLGYTPEEWISGRLWYERLHPEDRERVLASDERFEAGGEEPFSEEYRLIAKDGSVVWVREEAVLVKDGEGEPLYWQGVIHDLTERKEAEEELRRSEERLRGLADSAFEGILISDGGEILEANHALTDMLGYELAEVVGRSALEFIAPEHRDLVRSKIASGAEEPYEIVGVRNGGERLDLEVRGRPFLYRGRNVRVTAVRDVTERKAAEDRLRTTEERYRTLVERMPAVTYIQEAAGSEAMTYVSPQMETMLGYAPEECISDSHHWIKILHPDDRERVLAENRRTGETGEPFDEEYRMLARDGSVVWMHDASVVLPGVEGRPSYRQGVMYDVTERRQTEEALQASELRLRTVIEQSPLGINIFDPDGTSLLTNGAWDELWYLDAEEAAQQANVFEDEQLRDAGLVQYIERSVAEGAPVVAPLLLFDPANSGREIRLRWLRTLIYPVKGVDGRVLETVMLLEDVTERKRAEDALGESEERYRAVVEQSAEAIWMFDPKTKRVLETNATFQEMLGYDAEELRGMTNYDFVAHSREDVDRTVDLKVRGEENARSERKYRRKDGTLIDVEVGGTVISYRGKEVVCSVARDITERKRVEEEIRETNRRLGELATLRADFTAMVAHELDTPLAVIRGYADVLATGELGAADSGRALAQIQSETEVLNTLVEDVRVAATAERRDFAVNPKEVPVDELLEAAACFVVTLPGNHPLDLEHATDAAGWGGVRAGYADAFIFGGTAGGRELWADRYRIGQVLRNLLANAVKYSPEGAPIGLRAVPGEVPGRLRIEVADCGPGIHPDDLERIFEKFGRGRSPEGRKVSGVGLGLYLSRRILRAHGSDLTISARPGGGSVFGFELEEVVR